MFAQLPILQKLIRHLQRVPYLASKNVYKVAVYFLQSDQKTVEQLCAAILEAKQAISRCSRCCNWTEHADLCSICASTKRDTSTICVVETWFDFFAIENAGEYKGLYHVLGGALCPLEGIGPDQLSINQLIKRLDQTVKELIFATNPTPEGEATASFIWTKMRHLPINVSRLASGVPTGASLEYMDKITIGKALIGRRPF